jgi:hypothetical protein
LKISFIFYFSSRNEQKKKARFCFKKQLKSNPEKLLPNKPISASPNGPYRRDVLAGNLEEVAVHIILKVASTMGGYTSDVRLA